MTESRLHGKPVHWSSDFTQHKSSMIGWAVSLRSDLGLPLHSAWLVTSTFNCLYLLLFHFTWEHTKSPASKPKGICCTIWPFQYWQCWQYKLQWVVNRCWSTLFFIDMSRIIWQQHQLNYVSNSPTAAMFFFANCSSRFTPAK